MLTAVAVLALATFALVRLVRKLAPQTWTERAPIGCSVCISTWAGMATTGAGKAAGLVVATAGGWPVVWLAVSGGALLLVEAAESLRPVAGPPLPPV